MPKKKSVNGYVKKHPAGTTVKKVEQRIDNLKHPDKMISYSSVFNQPKRDTNSDANTLSVYASDPRISGDAAKGNLEAMTGVIYNRAINTSQPELAQWISGDPDIFGPQPTNEYIQGLRNKAVIDSQLSARLSAEKHKETIPLYLKEYLKKNPISNTGVINLEDIEERYKKQMREQEALKKSIKISSIPNPPSFGLNINQYNLKPTGIINEYEVEDEKERVIKNDIDRNININDQDDEQDDLFHDQNYVANDNVGAYGYSGRIEHKYGDQRNQEIKERENKIHDVAEQMIIPERAHASAVDEYEFKERLKYAKDKLPVIEQGNTYSTQYGLKKHQDNIQYEKIIRHDNINPPKNIANIEFQNKVEENKLELNNFNKQRNQYIIEEKTRLIKELRDQGVINSNLPEIFEINHTHQPGLTISVVRNDSINNGIKGSLSSQIHENLQRENTYQPELYNAEINYEVPILLSEHMKLNGKKKVDYIKKLQKNIEQREQKLDYLEEKMKVYGEQPKLVHAVDREHYYIMEAENKLNKLIKVGDNNIDNQRANEISNQINRLSSARDNGTYNFINAEVGKRRQYVEVEPEEDQEFGSGLRRRQRGHGLPNHTRKFLKKQEAKMPFGKFALNLDKLRKNIVSLSYPNTGLKVNGFSNMHVSDDVIKLLMKKKIHKPVNLSEEEKLYLNKLFEKAGIVPKPSKVKAIGKPKEISNKEYLSNRSELLMGEIDAGNDNKAIRNELNKVVDEMVRKGMLTNVDASVILSHYVANI